MTIGDLAGCLRVRQWSKNSLLFAALIFARHAHQADYLSRSSIAFILFSLITGAVYTLNDIVDIAKDREHPLKKTRPIASGRISIKTAWFMVIILFAALIPLSFLFDTGFGLAVLVYIFLQIAYSVFLKNVVILDVFVISFGFLLRVIAGALAIHVVISNWILVCTMLLALFLALSKRRHELVLLENNADSHRQILREYSPYLLDQMIGIVTSATLVAYMIFTLSDETTAKFGSGMILTVPFVLYGIFRYLYLVHQKKVGGQPEEVLLSDIPLQLDILGYGIAALIVIYF
ncbi:decaprenyl-phosphate phosphoribosyltransferase [bacterium]|nr:decaprenyl-phosphate phosphoribosyltransferase [bacterium]